MVGLGARISPGSFFQVENDRQCQSKKCWNVLLKLAGNEDQKGDPWTLAPHTVTRLGSSLLPNFEPSGWFSFVLEVLALTL